MVAHRIKHFFFFGVVFSLATLVVLDFSWVINFSTIQQYPSHYKNRSHYKNKEGNEIYIADADEGTFILLLQWLLNSMKLLMRD